MTVSQQMKVTRFSTEIFNKIPTLEHSNRILEQTSPGTLSNLRDVIVDARLNDKFGYSLLHRHFPLRQQQILVELNGVTTPWTVSDLDLDVLCDVGFTTYQNGTIRPSSWMLVKQEKGSIGLMPYEFAFVAKDVHGPTIVHDNEYQPFIQLLAATLEKADLQGCMALTVLSDVEIDGAIETTVGPANILRLRGEHNVLSPIYPSTCQHPHEIQASFFWPTGPDGKVPMKARGSKCDSMDTYKCSVKDAPLEG